MVGSEISIHALREEGDSIVTDRSSAALRFLSTPSARRATIFCQCGTLGAIISIHALREEGDVLVLWYNNGVKGFLSTPSARRATNSNLIVERVA